MDGAYKGVGGWKGIGGERILGVGGVGGQAEGETSLPLGHRQWCCALNRRQECTQTTG